MGNRVTIQRTVFKNYGKTEETFGFRMYDDYGQSYSNCIPEEQLKLPDEDFFNLVCDEYSDENSSVMIDWVLEHGCYIDSTWYEAKELMEWRGE